MNTTKKAPTARVGQSYGMAVLPTILGSTWIEGEMMCSDVGQFRRRAYVIHKQTGQLVLCTATIPDTYFSIPATTKTETGYITSEEVDAVNRFVFVPHTEQNETPAAFRKAYRKACR